MVPAKSQIVLVSAARPTFAGTGVSCWLIFAAIVQLVEQPLRKVQIRVQVLMAANLVRGSTQGECNRLLSDIKVGSIPTPAATLCQP